MDKKLVFIKYIGKEEDGYNRYEFFFSDNIKHCRINNDDCICGLANGIYPESIGNDFEKHIVKTKVNFDLLQDNCCFTYFDGEIGVVAIAIENLDDYDEYPTDGRLIFMYGDDYDDIEDKLGKKRIIMK